MSAAIDTPTFDGPRPARLDERAELLAMINYVFRVSRGYAPTIATDWPHVYAPENLANVMVVSDPQRVTAPDDATPVGGKVVASTGVWVSDVTLGDVTLRVGGINCVGTLPEYRRHGLGSQVMAAAHRTMRDLGCHVGLLSTGITNWYRRMGWENAGIGRDYHLNRGNVSLLPQLRPGLRVRVVELGAGDEAVLGHVGAADWAAVVRLHDAARFGAARTAARWRQLVQARRVEHLVLAEEGDTPVAYLLLRDDTIIEWAGAAADVLGLAAALFGQLDDHTASTSQRGSDGNPTALRMLLLETPGSGVQQPIVPMLDARGIPFYGDYLGMLYVIDPQAILAAYGVEGVQLQRTHLDDGEETFVVDVGATTLTLDRRQLTKLFFGPERLLGPEESRFPLPFWQWSLELV